VFLLPIPSNSLSVAAKNSDTGASAFLDKNEVQVGDLIDESSGQ
jgi:hypothetical protein